MHYFVGGATKMFGAAMFRLREREFTARRTADGSTPDWPIRYEELVQPVGAPRRKYAALNSTPKPDLQKLATTPPSIGSTMVEFT